jgi:CRISPR-associated protein Cmr6
LENGFAFLNPYGLPYLPGSGVKGVLRQAARELASGKWGDTQGWNDVAIEALFGSDPEQELKRGALIFWDVIPQLAGDRLAVDIMTPHQTHYYQQGDTPHESGSPNPISFLTVPPKSSFTFYVQCDTALLGRLVDEQIKMLKRQGELGDIALLERLARNLVGQWRGLLEAAFEHAFDWLGFGAKTSVGYGAMREDPAVAQKRQAEQEAVQRQQEADAARSAREALPPGERLLSRLDVVLAELPRDPRNGQPIKQLTSVQEWTQILEHLRDWSQELDGLSTPEREKIATTVKQLLNTHFKVEGKAEKNMKQCLAALRGQ